MFPQTPWLIAPALDKLKQIVTPDSRVLEFGSGASTLYLAELGARVSSVEHTIAWFTTVQAACAARTFRHQPSVSLRVPTPCSDVAGAHAAADYTKARSFVEPRSDFSYYCAAGSARYDLAVIDGRARPGCIYRCHLRIKPGGYLLLDDAQRVRYGPVQAYLLSQGWTCETLQGELTRRHGGVRLVTACFFKKGPECQQNHKSVATGAPAS